MVPESVRSGRTRTGAVNSATIGAAAGAFIGADDKRVSLRIFSASANRITISDQPAVVLDGGINIPAGGTSFEMSIERDGNLVTKRLFAIASAGGTVIGFIESRLEET
jgi:hypothetical protein